MQVGSICEVLPYPIYQAVTWKPEPKDLVTIRIIEKCKCGCNRTVAVFEEGEMISLENNNIELALNIKYLREVQPPVTTEEVMSVITDIEFEMVN